nr:C45 family peptidase [Candidatus Sigynarchaeota archaeon]
MVLFIETHGTARERGEQQGTQLKDRIQAAKKAVFKSEIFKEMIPKGVPVFLAIAGLGLMGKNRTKKFIEQHFPKQNEKLIGIAKGAGVGVNLIYGMNYVEVMAGNPLTTYREPLVQACTMIMALPPATADGSIIYGRNYDFPTILQPYQMVRREIPDDGFKTITLTQYPMVGAHIGLNEKGVLMGYNYGRSWKSNPLDYRPRGVPNLITLQEALESCKSTQEVIDFISKFPARTNGAHFGVVDESGDACVIETTATRHVVRRPKDGILAHTNMYQELVDANVPDTSMWKFKGLEIPYTRSPKERFARANELLAKAKGKVTLDTFKGILSDHAGREPDDFTICTHGKTGATLASILVKPKEREFWVTDNQPCKTNYEKFTL